jgi:hypothetical protein
MVDGLTRASRATRIWAEGPAPDPHGASRPSRRDRPRAAADGRSERRGARRALDDGLGQSLATSHATASASSANTSNRRPGIAVRRWRRVAAGQALAWGEQEREACDASALGELPQHPRAPLDVLRRDRSDRQRESHRTASPGFARGSASASRTKARSSSSLDVTPSSMTTRSSPRNCQEAAMDLECWHSAGSCQAPTQPYDRRLHVC